MKKVLSLLCLLTVAFASFSADYDAQTDANILSIDNAFQLMQNGTPASTVVEYVKPVMSSGNLKNLPLESLCKLEITVGYMLLYDREVMRPLLEMPGFSELMGLEQKEIKSKKAKAIFKKMTGRAAELAEVFGHK